MSNIIFDGAFDQKVGGVYLAKGSLIFYEEFTDRLIEFKTPLSTYGTGYYIQEDGYFDIVGSTKSIELTKMVGVGSFNINEYHVFIRSSKKIVLEPLEMCYHEWREYIGLTQRDYYCSKCPAKKDFE